VTAHVPQAVGSGWWKPPAYANGSTEAPGVLQKAEVDMRTHRQSPIRYAHDEKTDTLYKVGRTHHVAYELNAKCSRCGQGVCFADQPLIVHIERAEAAWSS
jgi:ribosomal protein S27AE